MSVEPKIERRYRRLSREELGRLIRREAREALRIVRPTIAPRSKAKRPGPGSSEQGIPRPGHRDTPGRSDRHILASNVRPVPKEAVVRIPREPTDPAKALIARRESICARCDHFNGVCTLLFPQVKGCRSFTQYRPGWLAFAADAENTCPLGRWAADQK